MPNKNSSHLEDYENQRCTGGNCTPLSRRFPDVSFMTQRFQLTPAGVSGLTLQCQNVTPPQPITPLQAASPGTRIGLKPVTQLFTRAHKVIMCLCSYLSMFFCSLRFCNKTILKKMSNSFPAFKSSFVRDGWLQPWLYGVEPSQLPPAVSVPGQPHR